MTERALTLQDVRKQFPQYADMSDQDLADGLYERFYSDMPRIDFDRRVNAPLDMDWSRPVSEVRADIARLPMEDRPRALRQWADAFVRAERAPQQARTARDVGRNIARGTPVGPWLGELNALTQAGLHHVTGGRAGSHYDEALAYQDALDRASEADLGWGATAAQVAGGLASATRLLSAPRSVVGGMARATPLGAAYAFNAGAGDPGEGRERLESGLEAAPYGAAFGAVLPPVAAAARAAGRTVHRIASPTMARIGAHLPGRGDAAARLRTLGSDEAGNVPLRPPPVPGGPSAGADAARSQYLANELAGAGRTVDDLERLLADHDRSRRLWPRSNAPSAITAADLDPALARVLGAASRSSKEAAGMQDTFFAARQTGATPRGRQLEPTAGLPTRREGSLPFTGAQARRRFGTTYGTRLSSHVMTGQRERVSDTLRRGLVIVDEKHHKHLKSAFQTRRLIEKQGKEASDKLYADLRLRSQGYNPGKAIKGVLDDVQRVIDDPATGKTEAELLQRGISEFYRNGKLVSSIDGFDQAQRALRAMYETADSNTRRVLGGLRQKLMDAVDNIKERDIGKSYAAARRSHADARRLDEAYEMGRKGPDEVEDFVGRYRAMETEAEQKLARLGLWEHYNARMARLKPTDDVTNIFKSKDYDTFERIVPRTTTSRRGKPRGAYGDRPERLADLIAMERAYVTQTKHIARGGSQTAERLGDDAVASGLQSMSDTFQRLRQGGTVSAMVINTIADTLKKVFGMRADVAASITRGLLTADRDEMAKLLADVRMRMGKNRYRQFEEYMSQLQTSLAGQGGRQAPNVQPEE